MPRPATKSVAMAATACALLALAACSKPAPASPEATYGANPPLAPPAKGGLPTINTAKPLGWPAGAAPTAPAGFAVTRYAENIDHPRQVYRAPNGDILVALSSSEPHKARGFTDWVAQLVQKGAGALNKSPNQIVLLRDADGDGKAEIRSVLIGKYLNQPFGMAVHGDRLYVGDTDRVLVFPYDPAATRIDAAPSKVIDLPHGENGHWTRSLLLSPDGLTLYVGVGSASNIADGGMAPEARRAMVLAVDLQTARERIYASGLRNPNSPAFEPTTGTIWVVVNERDMLGDDIVPDYMTGLKDGAFYGWPWSYYGGHVDERVKPANPAMVAKATRPDYALGAHTASLGLAFYPLATPPTPAGAPFPNRYRGGAFVGQHGSWNRSQPSGYKVVFVPFAGGKPSGRAETFLTGFLKDPKHAWGRPVGVAIDRTGALLVADDVGDVVWRVAPVTTTSAVVPVATAPAQTPAAKP